MRSSSAAARNICKSSWFTFTSPWYMKFRIATMSGKRILIARSCRMWVEDKDVTHPLRKIMGWGWEFFLSMTRKRGEQAERTSLWARTMSPSHTCNNTMF